MIPLFGMAVGYPERIKDQKPRLPLEHIYHEEEYEQDKEVYVRQLEEYDEVISSYYTNARMGKEKIVGQNK